MLWGLAIYWVMTVFLCSWKKEDRASQYYHKQHYTGYYDRSIFSNWILRHNYSSITLSKSISIISSFFESTEKSFLKNHRYARSAITFVSMKSKLPPITAPTPGRSFPKLTIPLVPNLVTNRNPTFWLIFVKTFPGIFFIKIRPTKVKISEIVYIR